MMSFIERDPDYGYDPDKEFEYEDADEERLDYEEYEYEAKYAVCPCCGYADEVRMLHNQFNGRYKVECNECGLEANFGYCPEGAAEEWNEGQFTVYDSFKQRYYGVSGEQVRKAASSKCWWEVLLKEVQK